jgi:hypothetical protein
LRTDPVTGTVMLLCNSNTRPKLNLQDPAMEDRVRKLAYPAIPVSDLDPGFKNRTKQKPLREAARVHAQTRAAFRHRGSPQRSLGWW